MDIRPNSSGMINGMPPVPQKDRKIGPIVGGLVIVLILIIAALYFFGQKLNTAPTTDTAVSAAEATNADNTANASSSMSSTTADEASLRADLDAELKDVDYSF